MGGMTRRLAPPARCRDCSKPLVWAFTRAPRLRLAGLPLSVRRKAMMARRASYSRQRGKIAIRCVWCLGTFCPRCAKKHFAPITRAQHAVDAKLAKIAALAIDVVIKGWRHK